MDNDFPIPPWYINATANNSDNALSNAVLPYLSSINQKAVMEDLGVFDSANFNSYRNANVTNNAKDKRRFLSKERAQRTLSALARMRGVSGITDETPGFKYLVDSVRQLEKFGANSAAKNMSRAEYLNYDSAIKSLRRSNAANEDAELRTLAEYFTSPTLTSGELNPISRVGNRVNFGSANSRLFG